MIDTTKTHRFNRKSFGLDGVGDSYIASPDYDILAAERDVLAECLRSMTTVPEYSPSYPCWCDPESGRNEPHDPRCLRNRTVLGVQ